MTGTTLFRNGILSEGPEGGLCTHFHCHDSFGNAGTKFGGMILMRKGRCAYFCQMIKLMRVRSCQRNLTCRTGTKLVHICRILFRLFRLFRFLKMCPKRCVMGKATTVVVLHNYLNLLLIKLITRRSLVRIQPPLPSR